MSDYCEDCGCRVYSGNCVNCNEEYFIEEQDRLDTETHPCGKCSKPITRDETYEHRGVECCEDCLDEVIKLPRPAEGNPKGDPLKMYDLAWKNRIENGIG